jgi:transposase InsO family protein
MDGFCKLDFMGVEVYAAIDVYSRYIIWIYIGVDTKTQASIAAQYLAAVASFGVLPKTLRTDRGSETAMVADFHYQLSSAVRPRDDGTPLGFSECFKYGTSKQNSRIESWWNQQSKSAVSRWRDFFQRMIRTGKLHAFLAVFSQRSR